jgi:hypothetical protein
MKHPQAELIKQWLDDTSQQLWYWNSYFNTWLRTNDFNAEGKYAIGDEPPEPPVKIRELAGVKFPAPVLDAALLKEGNDFFVASMVEEEHHFWGGIKYDSIFLEAGLVHLTKEAARQHSKALQAANLQAIKEAK